MLTFKQKAAQLTILLAECQLLGTTHTPQLAAEAFRKALELYDPEDVGCWLLERYQKKTDEIHNG